MDIVIRDLDAAVGAKLTQMAKKQGVSREECYNLINELKEG